MEVTSLPLDVLRSIWYYLNLPDVIRFGRTAKNMINLTWPYYQDTSMSMGWPINALSFILARDLSHVRSLELYYRLGKVSDMSNDKNIELLMQQLESLKFSKLSNLHTLNVGVEFPASDETAIRNQLENIKDIISKNNQLQTLFWYSAEVEDNFNVGQFFLAHKRLTKLTIHTKNRLIGFHLLTQLKSLDLSLCENLDDDTVLDAMALIQLQSFNIADNDTITDKSFTKITNLTNLEELGMQLNDGINSTSLKLLHSLPNLRFLHLNGPRDCDRHQFAAAVKIVGQLSQLTSLKIDNYDEPLDFKYLSDMTDLMVLDINTRVTEADFSNFTKLTELTIRSKQLRISTLPLNVQDLTISAKDATEDNIRTICSLRKLRHLNFNARDFDATIMALWITQLTQLFELVVLPKLPKELIPALQKLPNLASLIFSDPPDNSEIEELAKLTQVMELMYWSNYRADLKTKLPFNVNYIGDFDDEK